MAKWREVPSGGGSVRWFLVLAVVLGVLGMHSLLVDAPPVAASAATIGVVDHNGIAGAVSDRSASSADAVLAPAEVQLTPVSAADTPMVMGDMAMGCLAVLAAAALGFLALTSGGSAAPPPRPATLCASGGPRPSPPGSPSLLQLSVLRV